MENLSIINNKLIKCRCCKNNIIDYTRNRIYCLNCSKYIHDLTGRLISTHKYRLEKLREELKEKYNLLSNLKITDKIKES